MADNAIEIVFDERLLTQLLIQGGEAVRKEITKFGLEAALIAEAEMRRQVVILLADDPTGALARSIRRELVRSVDGEIEVHVGPHTVYARIQDEGGTVTPHKVYLAIPIPGAGVRKGKWPRDWGKKDLAFIKRPGKDPVLFSKTLARPVYVLKKRVTLKGVGYIRATELAIREELESKIATGLEALLEKVKAEIGSRS